MRVAIVIPSLDPRRGGAEHWTWQFAHQLAQRGHEVHVVAESFPQGPAPPWLIPHRLPPSGTPTAFAARACAETSRLNADIVHDMGSGWCADIFQPHGGSRTAAWEHNLRLVPRYWRWCKRAFARYLPRYRRFAQLQRRQYVADGRLFIALSQMVAEHFQRYHGVAPDDIRLVYNGVDTERFAPQARARYREPIRQQLGLRDELLLLTVAHNFELKGVPTVIAAVGALRRRGMAVHAAIVGGRRVAARYRRLVCRCGAQGGVTFVGSADDTVPYFAAADVYLHPTWYDPCSLVVLEALACGVPVITSRFNGAGELIRPGRQGYVVDDPGDVAAVTQQLEPLLDPARRAAMGQAARQLALQHTLEHNVDQLLHVYHEQLERRATRRRIVHRPAAA
jgi:UDP-glucose:(heptosyl)LPS alpha-1,3-glucosyltransferase